MPHSPAPGQYGVLFTTTGARGDAQRIAEALLAAKLAACVQVMPVESWYHWKGAVANDAEFLLLIKTRTAHFEAAMQLIRESHPYETPEIVGTTFAAGLPAYLRWIDEVTE